MDDNVGPWSRVTRPTKIGRTGVQTQQEYEQLLKNTVNSTASKQD